MTEKTEVITLPRGYVALTVGRYVRRVPADGLMWEQATVRGSDVWAGRIDLSFSVAESASTIDERVARSQEIMRECTETVVTRADGSQYVLGSEVAK